MRRLLLGIVGLMVLGGIAFADPLPDPAREAQARALFQELRCLVCQNQSIADSDAPLAEDLRNLVREQVAAGRTDADIKEFLVARYGEFVLLRPRLRLGTIMLWVAPFALLLGAGIALAVRVRSVSKKKQAPFPLTPEEEARLRQLVDDTLPRDGR